MLLSYTEICTLIEQGVIEGATYESVNSSSLDIHLGKELLIEDTITGQPDTHDYLEISLKSRTPLRTFQATTPILLRPNVFILAQSREIFHLPNTISAEYKLKSSMARIGLEHLNAGWCDAGWNGSVLTLELKNMTRNHSILLQEGDAIGQIVFFRHTPVPEDKSYAARGRYNNDKTVMGAKKK